MADIRTLTVDGTTYNIKDATARADIVTLQTNVTTLQTNVTTLQENTADLPQIRENVENNSDDISDLKSAIAKNQIYDTASGAIASFPDGADNLPIQELAVNVDPVQDLHGYDSPWPVGGGKNVFYHEGNITATLNGVTATFDEATQTLSITGTNTSTSAFILLNISCTGDIPRETPLARALVNIPSGVYINFVYRKNNNWTGVNNGGVIPTDIDEDSPINFQIGILSSATTLNANGLHIQIERGSTAPTSWTPYSNICPISGRTGVTVTRTGKNLGYISESNYVSIQRCTQTYENNEVTITATGTYARIMYRIPVRSGETYTISFRGYGDGYRNVYIMNSESWDVRTDSPYAYGTLTIMTTEEFYYKTFTAVTDAIYIGFYATTNENVGSMVIKDFQLELGSTATDYEPYQGNTYDIEFPSEAGTVYGGTLDVTSGVLTVDRKHIKIGNLFVKDGVIFRYNTAEPKKPANNSTIANIISSVFKAVSQANLMQTPNSIAIPATQDFIRIYAPDYSTTESFAAAFSNEDIVYELATPITYTLTAAQVRTLLGHNNIWSDAGNVDVIYPADTKLYIDSKIAEAIAAALNV